MPKTRSTVYIDSEKWCHFMDACSREGSNASAKIESMIDQFLAVHGEGNPQTALVSSDGSLVYADHPQCLPLWKTCRFSKGELRRGGFVCNHPVHGYTFLGPSVCEDRNREKKCYRGKKED